MNNYKLEYVDDKLCLRELNDPKKKPFFVEFAVGMANYRRLHGRGFGEGVAKAVGVRPDKKPVVIDACAGFGQDAFILASLGCHVTLIEQSETIYLLLKDGIERASKCDESSETKSITERMILIHGKAEDVLNSIKEIDKPDVIYLDPMFPDCTKSALVKRPMKLLQELAGHGVNAEDLLTTSLRIAKNRVVVKRPIRSGVLGGIAPSHCIENKGCRFDVYMQFLG